MNPKYADPILSLISDLYSQIMHLQQTNEELRDALAQTPGAMPDAMKSTTTE